MEDRDEKKEPPADAGGSLLFLYVVLIIFLNE